MKIAIITDYWINSDGGGVKEFTKNLVSALKNEKKDVIVLFRNGSDNVNYKLPFTKIKFILKAIRILNIENPDIILSQGGWFAAVPAIIFKKAHKDTKILYLFHTPIDKRFSYISKVFLENIFNRLDNVGFVSKGLCRNILNDAGLKINNKYILYAGVEITYPNEDEIADFKKKFNISTNYTYLLGLGLTAISIKKEGAKLLMRSLKKIIKRYPNTKLILTRKGFFEQELKDYGSNLGLSDHIIFTGDLENPYVAIVICDIYTHISFGEGLPLAILESMYLGKPIIASMIGGISEAIESDKTGILVNNNEDDIYSAITRLIEDKELSKRFGNSAKMAVKERFTWKKTVDNLIKIF